MRRLRIDLNMRHLISIGIIINLVMIANTLFLESKINSLSKVVNNIKTPAVIIKTVKIPTPVISSMTCTGTLDQILLDKVEQLPGESEAAIHFVGSTPINLTCN